MELEEVDEDEWLGNAFEEETHSKEATKKKQKLQTDHVNAFHYPDMDEKILQDLDSYMKWHKEHPGTTTPRKARGRIAALLDAGEIFVADNDPQLVYTQSKSGRGQRIIPSQFKSQEMGKDAEFVVVTAKAHSHEHHLRLKESLDFEDPWWNKSVRDQIFVHHTNDFHQDEGSCETDSPIPGLTTKSKVEEREAQRRAKAEQLALESSWGKKPRATRTVWEDPLEFSKYTMDGVEALEGFTAEALERNLEFALKEYEASESDQSQIKVSGLSIQAAELHKRLTDYRETLGGLEATEKMSEQFVKYSTKIRKQVEGGGSLFDGKTGDFLDACVKSNPAKVIPMLMFRADPNTKTEDDEPVFVMTMKKIVFSDASKGSEQERDTKERRNCFKIMEALVQYGADIDCLVTEAKLTPLMIVASAGHTELVKWLLDKGANPNLICPINSSNAMMLASKYGYPKCIAEIVRKKGSLTMKDKEGNSALHYAALFGQTRTAKFLLRIGAPRFQRNHEGKRAAEVASQSGYFVTAQIIAGFCPPEELSAPALKYISNHLSAPQKVAGGVTQTVASFFRMASNLFGPSSESSESWYERFMDFVSRLRARIREFETRDFVDWILRARQQNVQVQPLSPQTQEGIGGT